MFLYDYDAMCAPACRTSHQLIIHADQLLCHNPLHIVCKKKGPNCVSGDPRDSGGESSEGSDAGRPGAGPA